MAKVPIQETRKLAMPVETVVDAILELDRSHGGALCNAKLSQVRVETGAEPRLTLILAAGAGAAPVEKHFSLAAIAAAVIHYCFRARIPLPRHATKSIEVVPGSGFHLTIQTNTEVLRLHGEVPEVIHAESAPGAGAAEPAHAASGDAALDDPTSTATGTSPSAAAPETPAIAAA